MATKSKMKNNIVILFFSYHNFILFVVFYSARVTEKKIYYLKSDPSCSTRNQEKVFKNLILQNSDVELKKKEEIIDERS